jgi:restriction system protein
MEVEGGLTVADSRSSSADTLQAFDMLLEEMGAELERLRHRGAEALEAGNLKAATQDIRIVERLHAVRKQVEAARSAWKAAYAGPRRVRKPGGASRSLAEIPRKVPRGQLIPMESYFLPILKVVAKMGGSCRSKVVLDAVAKIMHPLFTEADLAPIASNPNEPRWRKLAQWARLAMVKEGLLRDDSPRGVWEITEKGLQMLEREGIL